MVLGVDNRGGGLAYWAVRILARRTMTLTLADHVNDGTLSLRFFCMDWPRMTDCGEHYVYPTARFDLSVSLSELEAASFCPNCRNTRIQIHPIPSADTSAPFTPFYSAR